MTQSPSWAKSKFVSIKIKWRENSKINVCFREWLYVYGRNESIGHFLPFHMGPALVLATYETRPNGPSALPATQRPRSDSYVFFNHFFSFFPFSFADPLFLRRESTAIHRLSYTSCMCKNTLHFFEKQKRRAMKEKEKKKVHKRMM